ncbi:MAG: dipeptide epimerase [Actinomycetota bacterium]|nr:dipeptide epimerase [Actinomycetota bacterium]
MTIREVRCHEVSVSLHTPFVTALRRTTTVDSLLVEVADVDGVVGVGEAPQVWAVTGDSLAGARACIEGPLASLLVGREPYDLHALSADVRAAVVGNTSAIAAVDVALHDLVARRLGVALPVLLGGSALRVPTDVTVSAGDADELGEVARERVRDGFATLKLKVGTDAATDVARVLAVRDAVGPEAVLRLDANQGWSAREAVRVISELEDAGADVELVEQPVRAADLDGLAWVTDRVRTPVLADESVFSIRDLSAVIARRAADMVNVKLAKAGGIVPARTLLELARAHEMGTMVGSMMETHVGVGAAASVVAALGTTAVSDLDAAWWAVTAPVAGGLRYEGGTVVLPDVPGLGLRVHR